MWLESCVFLGLVTLHLSWAHLMLARVLFMFDAAGLHLARVLCNCGLVALHLSWVLF